MSIRRINKDEILSTNLSSRFESISTNIISSIKEDDKNSFVIAETISVDYHKTDVPIITCKLSKNFKNFAANSIVTVALNIDNFKNVPYPGDSILLSYANDSLIYINKINKNIKLLSDNDKFLSEFLEGEIKNYFKKSSKITNLYTKLNYGDVCIENKNGVSALLSIGKTESFIKNNEKLQRSFKIRIFNENLSLPDLYKDKLSVWLTEEKIENLKLSSEFKAYKDKKTNFENSTIIMFADNIVLNSILSDIYMSAKKNINISATENLHLDFNKCFIKFNKEFNIESEKTKLIINDKNIELSGEKLVLDFKNIELLKNGKESYVKGDQLKSILNDLIDAIIKMTVSTPVGPSSPPLNVNDFINIKVKIFNLLENKIKV